MFDHLSDITTAFIHEQLDDLAQSNAEMDIFDLEWFVNIDPGSFLEGGAVAKGIRPAWATGCDSTWQDQGVNCCAYALAFLLSEEKVTKNKVTRLRAIEEARLLADLLEWGDTTTVPELSAFVKAYPRYRVSVIWNSPAESQSYTYYGEEYEEMPEAVDGRGTNKPDKFTLYLILSGGHWAACKSPAQVWRKWKGYSGYCNRCIKPYNPSLQLHDCTTGRNRGKPELLEKRVCERCGIIGKHECAFFRCKNCSSKCKKGQLIHRCLIYEDEPSDSKKEFCREVTDGKHPSLWAYDFESRLEIKESSRRVICDFVLDEDDQYPENVEDITVWDFTTACHRVNYAYAKNIFTGETREFFGDSATEEFINFCLTYNKGNNIFVAHNASGYDARLIFSSLRTRGSLMSEAKAIMRGNKFMQITIGKLIFRDSLLHLPQSLAALAKDFCSDTQIEKGFFPHLFNSVENYDYVGKIPDLKYFDASFCKTAKAVQDLKNYHASWQDREDWNFMLELKKYCKNDVDILAEIMLKYHNNAMELFGLSPWLKSTAASYVHWVFLVERGKMLELPDRAEDEGLFLERVERAAKSESWAALVPIEYFFTRKALRGGRTDVRKLYHAITEEQRARGEKICYQDICSEYPYQQIEHDFPVGIPEITIYDPGWIPCAHNHHQDDTCLHFARGACKCGKPYRDERINMRLSLSVQPSREEMMSREFFGIVCASVTPPKDLYHPVLVQYDESAGKCIASCDPISEGVFTSVELQRAIERGYTIDKIYRFDKYTRKGSLWRDTTIKLFIEKMVNSKNEPSEEEAQRLISSYDDKFGIGDLIARTFEESKWGKNPAKKQTAKIMMNSVWGKHAERHNQVQARFFTRESEDAETNIYTFYQNLFARTYELMGQVYLSDDVVMCRFKDNEAKVRQNFHKGYLPAAVFVPAYGRLQLEEQLFRLGKRVLMNDTDSIVYHYIPGTSCCLLSELLTLGEYNIPEGDLLGEWEVEDIDKQNGGIAEFVGLGPKTYAIRTFENDKTVVKAKGLSLRHATGKLVNFKTMRGLVFEQIRNNHARQKIKVPQTSFVYTPEGDMRTYKFLKDLKLDKANLKGKLVGPYLYPYGYEDADRQGDMQEDLTRIYSE